MAAGLGFIEFATGDILTASAANGYLASQTVMVFADSAARTTAITSPQEGMVSYLKSTDAIEYYSGSAWVAVGGSAATFTGVSCYNSGSQTISNNTDTIVLFDSELYDTNTFHSTSSNTGRITIPTGQGGYYQFNCSVQFQNLSGGNRRVILYKNGSTMTGNIGYQIENGSGLTSIKFTAVFSAVATDYFEMVAFADQGGAMNLEAWGTSFQAIKVG
jgi:hypothetical protein